MQVRTQPDESQARASADDDGIGRTIAATDVSDDGGAAVAVAILYGLAVSDARSKPLRLDARTEPLHDEPSHDWPEQCLLDFTYATVNAATSHGHSRIPSAATSTQLLESL